jgi:carboxylesterase
MSFLMWLPKILNFKAAGLGLCGAAILLLCSGCAYNYMARRALDKEINRLPRDPKTQVVNGTEAVTLPGTGPNAALLVHGFVGSRIDYDGLGPLLQSKGLTVRLMRLPGHGTTPSEHAVTTNEQLTDAVHAEYLALKRNHPQVALVGFSMGGALSVMVASQEQVDRLVLIAPYYGVTHRWYYGLPAETWNRMTSWAFPYVMKNEVFSCVNRKEAKKELYCYRVISTRGAAELIELGKQARNPSVLARVTCPVLVLHSHGDQAASPSRSEKAFESIGSHEKRFVWYEKSNHHILWDYDAEEAKAEIVGFLEPLWGSRN